MREFVERIAVAEAKKELLSFTIDVLKDEGLIPDESFNKWRNIKGGSLFDGVSTKYDCWSYGLKWEYVQIAVKKDVIKITTHLI